MSKLLFGLLFLFTVWNLAAQQPGFNRLYDQVPGGNIGVNILTLPDGFVMGGTTETEGTRHVFLLKLDPQGDAIWTKDYQIDTFRTGAGRTGSLLQTFDGGFANCGELVEPSTSEAWAYILKFDNNGDSLWHFKQKQFGSYEFSAFYAMCQTADSGFVAVGFARDPVSQYDLLIAKVSKQGTLEWYQTHGNNNWQAGYSIVELENGFCIGAAEWSGADSDPFVIRLDSNGNEIWRRDFDNTDYGDGGAIVYEGTDGNLYVGSSWTIDNIGVFTKRKAFIAKLTENNTLLWSGQYGVNQINVGIVQIRERRNGNPLFLSPAQFKNDEFGGSVGWVLELSPEGDSLFETRYNAAYNNHFEGLSYAWSMDTTLDGGFITGGFVQGEDTMTNENFQNLWVVKFDSNGCFDSTFNCGSIDTSDTLDGILESANLQGSISIWPNPSTDAISISLSASHWQGDVVLDIFSAAGSQMHHQVVSKKTHQVDIKNWSPGVYILYAVSAEGIMLQKFVKAGK